jgi:hypothetical protein
MRKLLAVLAVLLIVSACSWAQIVQKGGTAPAQSTSATSITGTYTISAAGDPMILFLTASASITGISCKDQNSNALTAGPVANQATAVNTYSFYGTTTSGATSYKCTWSVSSNASLTLEEYGCTPSCTINASLSGNTAFGSSTSPSITVTTQDANDWVVCGFSETNALTVTAGTLRQSQGTSSVRAYLVDNTVAAAGSVSCSGTIGTSSGWAIALIELRLASSGVASRFDKRRKLARLGVL